MERNSSKIAIFGGAFDPPHNVHIDIAREAVKEFGYERIIFLPSYNPPHKNIASSEGDRLNMLRMAIAAENNFVISTFEIGRGAVGYTVDTLPKLRDIYGEFDFIIGGDSMRDFHKWYRPEQILLDNNIVVAIRDGNAGEAISALKAYEELPPKSVKLMRYTPRSISSTAIRLRVQLGLDITQYVPQGVAEYIADSGLYDEYKGCRIRLQSELSSERYRHSIGVVKMANQLNEQLKLDYEQVFLAALLHDCAKSDNIDYRQCNIPSDSVGTAVAHAFAGASVARSYGVKDDNVLLAIYYHTTGRADMTALEKLIYTADMVEESRDYESVEELRALCLSDFESGFRQCLRRTNERLLNNKTPIYYLTEQAYSCYCKNNR